MYNIYNISVATYICYICFGTLTVVPDEDTPSRTVREYEFFVLEDSLEHSIRKTPLIYEFMVNLKDGLKVRVQHTWAG